MELIPSFLCQLSFPDAEFRINNKAKLPRESRLGGLTASSLLFPTNFLASSYPNTSVQLNWHNASLDRVVGDWLVAASVFHNSSSVRNFKCVFVCFWNFYILYFLKICADCNNKNRLVK